MCGLFGVLSTTLSQWEIERAEFLGILSCTRGMDSTGVALLGKNKNGKIVYHIEKALGNSVSFLTSKQYKEGMDLVNTPSIYMGHTRLATVGDINTHNAHPVFEHPTILCHNGTIQNFNHKNSKDSDSRVLCKKIGKAGLGRTLGDAGYGAWAISAIDTVKLHITFARNEQRPLHFMYSKGEGTLYWASERWMLEALRAKEPGVKYDDPFMLPIETGYRFHLGSMKCNIFKLELKKPTYQYNGARPAGAMIPDTSGVATPLFESIFCRFCHKDEIYCSCGVRKTLNGGASVPLLPPPDKKETKLIYRGYEGSLIDVATAAKIISKGCFNCKKDMKVDGPAKWWARDQVMCEDCYDNDPLMKELISSKHPVYEGSLIRSN